MSTKGLIGMKILLANTTVGYENDPAIKDIVMPAWKQNYQLAARTDTEIISRFNTWGCLGMSGTFNHAIWQLNGTEAVFASLRAEQEGFDAVLITCFDDPWLWQIRQLIDIPVIGFGEAAMTAATMMGDKFGIVTASVYNPYRTGEQVARYGLKERCAGVRGLTIPEPDLFEGFINAEKVVDEFIRVGRELIRDGADILIPGCGLISPVLRLAAGMEDRYPNGLTELDGVPVLDVLTIGIKTAEFMADMRRSGSPWISRHTKYKLPTKEMLKSGAMCLSDERQDFWDLKIL